MKWIATIISLLVFLHSFAKNNENLVFTCQTMVELSLNSSCEKEITVQDVLNDDGSDLDNLVLELSDLDNNPIDNPLNEMYLGQFVQVTVTDTVSSESCQTTVFLKDTIAPIVELVSYAVTNGFSNIGGECFSQGFLQPATILENCGTVTVQIFTPIGEANYFSNQNGADGGFIPAPGLPLGMHDLIYVVTDDSGNETNHSVSIEIKDITPPTILCVPSLEVELNDSELTLTAVDLDAGSFDNCCLENLQIRRLTEGCNNPIFPLFSEDITVCCEDIEQPISVILRGEDCGGNISACLTTLQVKETIPPNPNCLFGLVIELEADGEKTWSASDFNAGSYDNCSTELYFSFDQNGTQPSETFNCNDVTAGELLMIYVWDEAGNMSVCETFVSIQDNNEYCSDELKIVGTVKTFYDEPINVVNLTLNSTIQTEEDGAFQWDDLIAGENYELTAEKDTFVLNGVSTFDILKISKHILGQEILDSPWKMIAADANKSGAITTLDLIALRRLVLLIDTEFANNQSWRFFDAQHEFADPSNPFSDMPAEALVFEDFANEVNDADFIGVKIGDVNLNADPNNLLIADTRIGKESAVFTIENQAFVQGQIVDVVIELGVEDVEGVQGVLAFNPKKLTFQDWRSTIFEEENVNSSLSSEGKIPFSWHGEQLKKNEWMRLQFVAQGSGTLEENLFFDQRKVQAEVYLEEEIKALQLTFVENFPSKSAQVVPNPFLDQAKIIYWQEETAEATLYIYDLQGTLLFTITEEKMKGKQQFGVKGRDLPKNNCYYFQIKTNNQLLMGNFLFFQ